MRPPPVLCGVSPGAGECGEGGGEEEGAVMPGRPGVLSGGVRGGRRAARRPGARGRVRRHVQRLPWGAARWPSCRRRGARRVRREAGARGAGRGARGPAGPLQAAVMFAGQREASRLLSSRGRRSCQPEKQSPGKVGERCSEGRFQRPGHRHAVPSESFHERQRLQHPSEALASRSLLSSGPAVFSSADPRDTPDPRYRGSSCTW